MCFLDRGQPGQGRHQRPQAERQEAAAASSDVRSNVFGTETLLLLPTWFAKMSVFSVELHRVPGRTAAAGSPCRLPRAHPAGRPRPR